MWNINRIGKRSRFGKSKKAIKKKERAEINRTVTYSKGYRGTITGDSCQDWCSNVEVWEIVGTGNAKVCEGDK